MADEVVVVAAPAERSMDTQEDELPVANPTGKSVALTPPTSEDNDVKEEESSELSDMEIDEEDIGEIEPDHYYDGGRVPVFKPTMDQFRSFKKFIDKIDKYGMRSGIVKVIPPQEWRDSLPDLTDAIKTIKVKNPIAQEFSGTHGTYTQANIERQRSYNLPQWKGLTEESNHQPPARRGERRQRAEAAPARTRTRTRVEQSAESPAEPPVKRKRGRPAKNSNIKKSIEESEDESSAASKTTQVPPTPTSPSSKPVDKRVRKVRGKEDDSPSRAKGRQPTSKSVSSRRMNNRREMADVVDEAAFKNFDYKLAGVEDYDQKRCQELEENYWKTLNYGSPLYGADMPGSLFNDSTTSWNVAKLENLLDVLGTKVPGVNTAYLYLGMWKATFAWHLEDVDLYSINYIHFGAPKQWYSISQEDARRFESAMKSIWPTDAKNCDQFLRHKTYLISPEKLKSQFNIKVNKLVHNEGEFVITYPYGYHSGFNLGYNCAESVNFATESWLNYGRIAKKCDCEADSVWVDVNEIERKLRGEPTPEYYEETDEEIEDEDDIPNDLPSPPASVKTKGPPRKRKRATGDAKETKERVIKRIKIRVKVPARQPCVLCPNDIKYDILLPTDNGREAHRLCGLYTPETYLVERNGKEMICNVANVTKARLELRCNFCHSKRGACFQCSSKKCARAFHATCAAAAGVLVDFGPVPTWDESGIEYIDQGCDFRCKFHRPRRPKLTDCDSLEKNELVLKFAKEVKANDVVQAQYLDGELVAGMVIENRPGEMSVLVEVLPDGDRIEIDWKYLLTLDPADSHRPKPSANALPLPEHLVNNDMVNASNRQDGVPETGDAFHDANSVHKWQEFNVATSQEVKNPFQGKIDFTKSDQIWYYLGRTSTEARAQYTEDAANPRHNTKGNFLDTVKPPPKPPSPVAHRSYPINYPSGVNVHALNGAMAAQRQQMSNQPYTSYGKPYQYKPRPDGTKYAPRPVAPGPSQPSREFHSHHAPATAPYPPSYSHSFAHHVRSTSNDLSTGGYPYQSHTYTQIQRSTVKDPKLAPQPPRLQPAPPRPAGNHSNIHPYTPLSAKPRQTSDARYPGGTPTSMSPSGSHAGMSQASLADVAKDPDLMTPAQYLQHIQQYPYLRNSYLRKPKQYQSPYAAQGGFTDPYMPLPALAQSARKASTTNSSSARPAGPYYGTTYTGSLSGQSQPHQNGRVYSHPSTSNSQVNSHTFGQLKSGFGGSTASYQYQTSQQFQQQLARDAAQSQNNRLEKMMAQLKSTPPKHTYNTTTSNHPPPRTSTPPSINPNATNNGGKTPLRPEYSPISEPSSVPRSDKQAGPPRSTSPIPTLLGSGPGSLQHAVSEGVGLGIQPLGAGIGGETWRFLNGGGE